jgi:hypothetical protein
LPSIKRGDIEPPRQSSEALRTRRTARRVSIDVRQEIVSVGFPSFVRQLAA